MITLKNFSADNIPTQKQVEDLGQYLMENFEAEIGNNEKGNGEGAIEMAVRLLEEYKKELKITDDRWKRADMKNLLQIKTN